MEIEVQEKKRPSQGWLPATLRWPYLFSLESLLLFLLAVVETLRQYSNRKGFLIHWSDVENLPGTTWQVYTYLPLVLTLLAIVLLDICAQDVFRLEIYFQLAKQEATPAKVLFTNYCSNGLTASMIALRNRHWIVLCVASVFLICRMFLPTLASGIISLDGTTLRESKSVHTWPSIVDLDTQMSWFNASLSHHGMLGRSDLGSMFLSRPSTYAAAPVSIPGEATENSFLTVNQTAYWSNLTCVTQLSTGNSNSTFSSINSSSGTNQLAWIWKMRDFGLPGSINDTDSRCRIDLDLEVTSKSNQRDLHARYWAPTYNGTDANSSFVPGDGCGSFELFGVMLDSRIVDGNITAPNITVLGCSPVYHQAQAEVTLNNNASIADLQTSPDGINPLSASDFHVSGLHDVISSKYTPQEQGISLSDPSLQTGNDLNSAKNSKQINSTAFIQEMQSSWNENFIVIINKLFNPAAPPSSIDATLTSYVVILVVAPNAAIFTEAILVVCLVILGMLAFTCHRRPNFLQWDPGSIAAQCALISRLFSPPTKQLFSHPDFRQATTRQLRQWSKGKWVEWVNVSGEPQLCIVDRSQPPSDQPSTPKITKGRRDPPPHFLVFPWFLTECVLLMGVLAAFGICLSYLRLQNIEDYATAAATLSIIFLTYAPTAIASIIGSLITSVYRNLSGMEPWIRLQEGMATAKDSIIANRGYRTPYMALTRTRRRKPALLFGISVVCLVDLVLRVLSGGVFEPQVQIYKSSSSSVLREYNPSLFERQANETGVGESIMAASRLMNNVSFLPWVSPEYFFVPFSVKHPYPDVSYTVSDADDDEDDDAEDDDDDYDDDDDDDDEDEDAWATFSAVTRGIGADLDCRTIYPEHKSNSTQVWKYRLSGGTGVSNCTVEIIPKTLNSKPGANFTDRSIQFLAPNGTETCQTSNLFIFASWNQNTIFKDDSTGWMALQCKPKVSVQEFNLEFDSHGMIQSYKPIPKGSITKGELYQNASISLGLFNQRVTSFSRSLPSHDPSAPQRHDWSGLLTSSTYDVLYPNNTEITSERLSNVARIVYRRMFSAHLALWRDKYLEHVPSKLAVPVAATAIESLWGLTPSKVLIVIIICLVCIDTSALVAVFVLRFNRFKGLRIPRSIGSLIPLVVGGSFAADCGDMYDMTEHERHALLLGQDRRYRLGEFAGETGDQWGLDYDDRHHTSEIELDDIRPAM